MIAQSTLKQRNQPQRECLYAWYPEVVESSSTTNTQPRDIYIHQGIDRTLLQENPFNRPEPNQDEVIQRYKQSIAPSERVYQSAETIDEALKTPWALHYEIERRPATPNLPSHTSDPTVRDEIPRRLKSAPLIRTRPASSILTVPEPQFIKPIITQVDSPARVRASSAKARLNSTLPASNNDYIDELPVATFRREIKSAIGIRTKEEVVPSAPTVSAQVFTEKIRIETPTVAMIDEKKLLPKPRPFLNETSLPPNLHHHHRPGVIAATNNDKKPVLRVTSAAKKSTRHRYHHHRHSTYVEQQRHEPLLALTPIRSATTAAPAAATPIKPMIDMNGIQLMYDRNLTLDDRSLNLTKYFINGNLYLIKDQHYNVIENFDPSLLERSEPEQILPTRPKYYQTIPIEKLQIPKPAPDLHYNASETYFYNTMPKRVHRYVIDPNFISEHLNVNKMALSERPPTGHGHRASSRETQRSSTAANYTRPVYA